VGHFAVSAIGRDRPGIVAGVAEGLLEVNGNVEDSRMTNLSGHFAVMLLVSTPAEHGLDRVEEALAPVGARLGLEALSVSEVAEGGLEAGGTGPDHVITVYGSDHPGIVHAISSGLAAAGVNITDLQTSLGGSADSPIYMMLLEVAVGDVNVEALTTHLREIAERAKVEIEIRPLDPETL
jgi:glycine cleavage system transcriptional repressor